MILLSVIFIVLFRLIETEEIFKEEEYLFGVHEFPNGHLKYYRSAKQRQQCDVKDGKCQKPETCWGYEKDCKAEHRFSYPEHFQDTASWAGSIEDQKRMFWEQGDFGYIKKRMDTMTTICKPDQNHVSSLRCTSNMEYCEAKNLFIDFSKKDFTNSKDEFLENIFVEGEIGGNCQLNKGVLKQQGKYKSALQSWYAELEEYSQLNINHFTAKGGCDEVIEKPVIFMKLDAGVNMYHHLCDFFNLYASQHINGSFSTDVYIVKWATSTYLKYRDLFKELWNVFTKHPVQILNDFVGKKMCFRNVVFPLLPRMVYGLYYNTALIQSCRKSGLFKAFSEHVLHRLGIFQDHYKNDEIRVTLLIRSTQYRNILNQNELIGAMKRVKGINVTAVDFKYRSIPFLDQLKISHNSDIFIGIHGAGLTHMLFQPDWATGFEIYNTEDADCYKDLANLRGLQYLTWERHEKLFKQDKGHHPQYDDHAKFTNYAFNVDEFMRILTKGIKSVIKRRPVI